MATVKLKIRPSSVPGRRVLCTIRWFAGKTLMITGGTGSFGNAVLNRFLRTDIGEIRFFSRDEKKQGDTKRAEIEEFNSDNTYRLDLAETKAKIGALEYIKKELNGEGNFVQ